MRFALTANVRHVLYACRTTNERATAIVAAAERLRHGREALGVRQLARRRAAVAESGTSVAGEEFDGGSSIFIWTHSVSSEARPAAASAHGCWSSRSQICAGARHFRAFSLRTWPKTSNSTAAWVSN